MASRNYINNREMFTVLVDYVDRCKIAKEAGELYPIIPDYLADCFQMIAKKLGTKGNFSGYSFLDDMKSDGVINCIQYIRNFNPDKSNNPFAYFTQIIKFAFLRRIENEKKQLYIKYKNYDNMNVMDDVEGIKSSVELNEISSAFIKTFEEKLLTAKRKNAKVVTSNTVTKFFYAGDGTGKTVAVLRSVPEDKPKKQGVRRPGKKPFGVGDNL